MNFDEMLAQVRDTLEREGRVAYRVLKRRFGLDDDDIEDIKADLIDAKRIASDEDGKVMVWAGATPTADPRPAEIAVEADRRMLTVMFCDVVDSTALAERFDAEELRDIIRQYQQTCSDAIDRFEGHVAQYLGDGLLIYFGYPLAQEDEAYQAVRSGLEILTRLNDAADITARLGTPLPVRIGIHTGPVVIGEMGTSGRHERLALGDTPNIAARIQGMARPNEILISESTQRLIEGLFDVEPLGAQHLKGVSKALNLYRVVAEGAAESRFEVALSTGKLTRFVGQEEELALLRQHWSQAHNARGQVILLSAEPGMGKSRLAQEFKTRIAAEEARHMVFRCSPYHQSSAFYPVIQVMQRAMRFAADDTPGDKLAKVDAVLAEYQFSDTDAAPLMSGLLSLPHPDLESLQAGDPQARRRRLLQVLTEWFLEESRRATVYMVWDDLHWADPSTLQLLEYYLDHVPASATLALLIYRSSHTLPWNHRGFFRYLSLNRLNDAHVEELAADVAGEHELPTPLLEHIIAKTDGIPLYVEELTRAVVDSGLLEAASPGAGDATLDQILIPATLQDSLEARLDSCPTGKEIAQWGATIGREFSYAVLRSVLGDDTRLKDGINELLDAELIYRSGSPVEPTFIFKHALLRDTAYESLLIRKRRDYHGQIAITLESEFPRIDETQPEVIAHHYTEGAMVDDAVRYWHRAGRYAINRSAHQEAMGHLQKGLGLLKSLPHTQERARLGLDIQSLLDPLVSSASG
jgi:class 3 adenylate cyclase